MDFITIVFVVLFILLLHKYSRKNFDYWEIRNVPYIRPKIFVGNFWKVLTLQSNIGDLLKDFCKQIKHPYFGVFFFNKPILVVQCPDLLKTILVKEYNSFSERTIISHERCGKVQSKYLLVTGGSEWKCTKTRLAQAFSSAKLNNTTRFINEVGENLKKYIRQNLDKGSTKAKQLCLRYSTEILASAVFGVEAHSFESENPEFLSMGKSVFSADVKTALTQTLYFLYPRLAHFLKIPFFPTKYTKFAEKVFSDSYIQRKQGGLKRNDFIEFVMHLKEKSKPGEPFELDNNRMAALAGQFGAAGFDSISSVMSFALYELSLRPDLQEKLRQEIMQVVKHHGSISYKALEDMKYMNMVLNETLRVYPVIPFLERKCTNDYNVPNSNFIIEKGTSIFVPILRLHLNANYFPNPETFNPDRFSDENKQTFPEFAFLPFGKGPKNCVGGRFGYLGCKAGLAHILSEFLVTPGDDTPIPLDFENKGLLMIVKSGVPLMFQELEKSHCKST